MRHTLFVLLFCGIFGAISAQETSDKAFLAFLHGGYGIIPTKTSGLTRTSEDSKDYVNKLSSGGVWNLQAYFRNKMFIVGLLYSGYTSSGNMESYVAPGASGGLKTSDHILTTYMAPQLGMNIPVATHFDIGWNAGIGGMWLTNSGKINENPRILKGGTLGLNLGGRGVYNFTKNIGISAEIMYICGDFTRTHVDYHDKNFEINNSPTVTLSQLDFSFGLKCSF